VIKVICASVFLFFGATALLYAPEGTILGQAWLARATSSIEFPASAPSGPNYRYGESERGDVVSSVSATGALAPVATVVVGTQVSGQVKELYADFNSVVKQGDVIALIDPVTFEHAAAMAEAEVAMTRAALRKAEVMLRDTQADLERKSALLGRGAGSVVDRIKAEAARDLARAQVDDATAAVRRAEAALGRARTDLERTLIRAPVDGIVIQRTVDAGQTVAASLQAPDLFTIAQDLREMKVHASIDESEIGRIVPRQRVEFTVDAFPGRRFAGTVEQIRKQPRTVQNVVTYTVVVKAPNPDQLLLPGMTASARFIVSERKAVARVPNGALRFRPRDVPPTTGPNIWVEEDGRLRAMPVQVGLTDGSYTEVRGEGVRENMRVIVGVEATRRSRSTTKRLLGIF
jgi:HlyD family secretion protein